jgi:hypothetical protein
MRATLRKKRRGQPHGRKGEEVSLTEEKERTTLRKKRKRGQPYGRIG